MLGYDRFRRIRHSDCLGPESSTVYVGREGQSDLVHTVIGLDSDALYLDNSPDVLDRMACSTFKAYSACERSGYLVRVHIRKTRGLLGPRGCTK